MELSWLLLAVLAVVFVAFFMAVKRRSWGPLVGLCALLTVPLLAALTWWMSQTVSGEFRGDRLRSEIASPPFLEGVPQVGFLEVGTPDTSPPGAELWAVTQPAPPIAYESQSRVGSMTLLFVVVLLCCLFAVIGATATQTKYRVGMAVGVLGMLGSLVVLLGVQARNDAVQNRRAPSFVSTPPRIEPRLIALDEEESAEELTEEPAEKTPKKSKDLPEWVTAPLPKGDRLFTVGPYATISQCDEETRRQMLEWLCRRAGVTQPKAVPPEVIKELEDGMHRTHLVRRTTSVGDVYLKHTQGHLREGVLDRVRITVNELYAKAHRERGRQNVALGGAGLLGLVGMLHLFLRYGPAVTPAVKEEAA